MEIARKCLYFLMRSFFPLLCNLASLAPSSFMHHLLEPKAPLDMIAQGAGPRHHRHIALRRGDEAFQQARGDPAGTFYDSVLPFYPVCP